MTQTLLVVVLFVGAMALLPGLCAGFSNDSPRERWRPEGHHAWCLRWPSDPSSGS